MTFVEALAMARANAGRVGAAPLRLHLAVGFTAAPLATFVLAQAARRHPERHVTCTTGPYGSAVAALDTEDARAAHAVLVALEWADLDPRLGLRRFGAATEAVAPDILETADAVLHPLADAIRRQAQATPVVLALPGLPLPPAFPVPGRQTGLAEIALRRRLLAFAEACLHGPDVAVVDAGRLDRASPPGARRAVTGELGADMPYAPGHLAALADALVETALPPPPLKGLITDLDDTLWRGLVGEVGPEAVSWDLDGGSAIHAVYQGLLAGLADQGVLLAVASRNAPETAEAALARPDLRLDRARFHPVEAGWGAKSDAVARILARWNVGADAVAFVDDSPLEVAEVEARFPGITGLVFPATDDAAALAVVERLRDLFGRVRVDADDRLRAASIRARAAGEAAERSAAEGGADGATAGPGGTGRDAEAFLKGLDARLTFDLGLDPDEARPLDLVNKTNQFNLNGRRIETADWKRDLRAPDRFAVAVAYADKFGPLGTVSVAAGFREGDRAVLTTWVLSCRAFTRRIEHATLAVLAERLGVSAFAFEVAATPRNGPVRDFLAELGARTADDGLAAIRLADAHLPPLYHRREIRDRSHGRRDH